MWNRCILYLRLIGFILYYLKILKSNLNLIFLEKKEMGKYIEIKNSFFVRSKSDKKRVIKTEKNIINISLWI